MEDATAARLPAELSSAKAARLFVREALDGAATDVVDTVELLTSEVVTNALLHAGAAPLVLVTRHPGRVRVSVADPSPTWPVARDVPVTALSGRGVALVDALATSWGIERVADDGKRVWFEVADADDC